MSLYAVVWTASDGKRQCEWHYGREDEAKSVAARLAVGWRKDAHVEARG